MADLASAGNAPFDRIGAQGGAAPSSAQISLPKGGGAIRGIGQKFAANPVTGTGSMSVPIATSPGRTGFGPQLVPLLIGRALGRLLNSNQRISEPVTRCPGGEAREE